MWWFSATSLLESGLAPNQMGSLDTLKDSPQNYSEDLSHVFGKSGCVLQTFTVSLGT